ncbi:hypothetical protein B9G69_004715 [Bdellovibrio sp. SKB1291214]|uniref:hypothetical protein n=1 Tax=Bdellovibrio sp. SKB1291214 TaxID=1732569 RepID=UPI000B518B59|nr:hypothetical protein [Bdellovibrio sp. SKB1291214]UYL09875.1 hypothetical protein B9G69_004715 [Bdellovibrio sp. SKB1291214]
MSNNDELLTSNVPRTLETKSKIMGFELSDVLILLLNLSIQNLIFGSTPVKIPMVFGTSAVIGLMLFFFKKGKPENHIRHYFEHLLAPTVRSANGTDENYRIKKGELNE